MASTKPDAGKLGRSVSCAPGNADAAAFTALAAALEGERYLRAVLNDPAEGVAIVDLSGAVRFLNPAGARIMSRALPGAAAASPFTPALHPGDRAILEQGLRELQAHPGRPVRGAIRILDANGGVLALRVHAVNLTGHPDIAGFVCAFHAITEQNEIVEALQESENRFRQMAEQIPVVYWMRDAVSHELLYVSPAFESIWGRPVSDLFHDEAAVYEAILPEHREAVMRVCEKSLAGEDHEIEFPIQRPDGALRWLNDRAFTIKDANGAPARIVGLTTDITERKHLQRQVQHVQKLESLGLLAGGIAHDFNNLLLAVMGNADLALLHLQDGPAREHLENIASICKRASELSNQMLAYSGRGALAAESIDLTSLVEEMAHLLRAAISKRAMLRTRLGRKLPRVTGDAAQLRQIVMNLLTNASDALQGQNGVISVSTGARECSRTYLRDSYIDDQLEPGLYIYIEVTDSGCGMSAETIARIFDPFFTTKSDGRGLGMAAVLGIVRAHRGAVKIYSEPGRGSTFRVLFPCAEAPAAEPEPQDPATGAWRGAGTVLLVDDEETVRAIGSHFLRRAGFDVITAADGAEALDIYRRRHPEIAAVVLDMTMPRMGGEEAFREMRRVNPNVRVLLSSGYSQEEALTGFNGKGLAGFIQKPYRVDEFLAKLRAILEESPAGG